MGQFKLKAIVKVIGKDSPHFNKLGMITDQFSQRLTGPLNVIYFSDNSTGTIKDSDLEEIKLDGPLIMAGPGPNKVTNDVYITESGGMVHVYTSGNVVYGEPPEGFKDRCANVHIQIPAK